MNRKIRINERLFVKHEHLAPTNVLLDSDLFINFKKYSKLTYDLYFSVQSHLVLVECKSISDKVDRQVGSDDLNIGMCRYISDTNWQNTKTRINDFIQHAVNRWFTPETVRIGLKNRLEQITEKISLLRERAQKDPTGPLILEIKKLLLELGEIIKRTFRKQQSKLIRLFKKFHNNRTIKGIRRNRSLLVVLLSYHNNEADCEELFNAFFAKGCIHNHSRKNSCYVQSI